MLIRNEFTFKYPETQEELLCEIHYMDGDNYSIHFIYRRI